MDQVFRFKDQDSRVAAVFKIINGGTMTHLGIGMRVHDNEDGDLDQRLTIDTILDSEFHMILQGLNPEQADALDECLLGKDPQARISRKVIPKRLKDGKIERRRIIEITGQAFDTVFTALAEAMPLLAPLVQGLGKVENPVWLAAYYNKNPFFGSHAYKAFQKAGKHGLLFEFEKLSIWIARDSDAPEHWILFKDPKDNTGLHPATRFLVDCPPINGGGTMHIDGDESWIEFSGGRRRLPESILPGMGEGDPITLENTIAILQRKNLLSAAEAERFATHLTLLGSGSQTIDMSRTVQRMLAASRVATR